MEYPTYCNIEYFNKYISYTIYKYNTSLPGIRGCHIMPQTQFVYFFDNKKWYKDQKIYQQNKKLSPFITEIIKFEDLQNGLNDLMDKYNLEHIKLPSENVQHPTNNKTCNNFGLTIEDLTVRNLRAVNSVYREDFINFGYQMIVI